MNSNSNSNDTNKDFSPSTSFSSILIELDDKTWNKLLDKAEKWFDNVLLIQSDFRKYAEDTIEKVNEPHIRGSLSEIAALAKEHERRVEKELYSAIGRESSKTRAQTGEFMAQLGKVGAGLQGIMGGASGAWRDLHQLLLVNLNAIGAFATAEQIGLALGLPEIIDITFPILKEKQSHQLILQEYMLEMAPLSILYDWSI